uniref:Uncharacterized protein n=1 Tax=Picea glauca TaxID=3330 RepID=A0A101LVW9_PICGL|nr:hypothetical protein ABT39_MTgene1813 [Picea glauca]QHR91831.1 hypothetical protein Q903MT_gene5867 [Picea sitchensis]
MDPGLGGTEPGVTAVSFQYQREALGVQILMMNALAEEPRDGMINWTAIPIKNESKRRKSDGTLHCPLQTPTHFIKVFLSRRNTSEMEVQSVPEDR